jgi:hypothetical protein
MVLLPLIVASLFVSLVSSLQQPLINVQDGVGVAQQLCHGHGSILQEEGPPGD